MPFCLSTDKMGKARVPLRHEGETSGRASKETYMDVAAVQSGSAFEPYPPVSPVTKLAAQTPDVTRQQVGKPGAASPPKTPEPETLDKEIAFANSVAELFDKKVSFSYDDRIKQVVVKVIQDGTEEVIRQIPAEEMIALRLQLKENFQGIILNQAG
jgi:flagellar protein FlaG